MEEREQTIIRISFLSPQKNPDRKFSSRWSKWYRGRIHFPEHLLYASQECHISSHLVLTPLLWRVQTLVSQSRKSELREPMKFTQGCLAGRKQGLDLCCLQTVCNHIKDMKSHPISKGTDMASHTKQQLKQNRPSWARQASAKWQPLETKMAGRVSGSSVRSDTTFHSPMCSTSQKRRGGVLPYPTLHDCQRLWTSFLNGKQF